MNMQVILPLLEELEDMEAILMVKTMKALFEIEHEKPVESK